MRYFRIPAFSGIEGHRNKPDRGTLRVVEGCIPYPAGALRSGPVWTTLGTLTNLNNKIGYAQDNLANRFLLVFFDGSYAIHSFPASVDSPKMGASISTESDVANFTALVIGGWTDNVKALLSNIGSRQVAMGNGGDDPIIVDMSLATPAIVDADVDDGDIYQMARVEFPNCSMFVRGPHKTLFAAGDPSNPLTVYVSEPAGLTMEQKDSAYSTGATSSVPILMTDATKITALSVQGPYVVVHTDHGVTLLYGSDPDQAETGFRVEQVGSPVASGAISHKVIGGQQNQPFFLGRDGQIYKDEGTTAGPDGKPLYSDPRQISWKAKGLWSDDNADDISDAFATYDPGLGMYLVHIPTKEGES